MHIKGLASCLSQREILNKWELLLLAKIRYLVQKYGGKVQGSTELVFPFKWLFDKQMSSVPLRYASKSNEYTVWRCKIEGELHSSQGSSLKPPTPPRALRSPLRAWNSKAVQAEEVSRDSARPPPFFLITLCGMQDLCSATRAQTCTPWTGSSRS